MKPELLIGGIDVIKFRNLLLAGQHSLSVQTVQTVQVTTSPYLLNYGPNVIHLHQIAFLKRKEAMGGPPVMGKSLGEPIGAIKTFQLGVL